jgi:hypothetical protein
MGLRLGFRLAPHLYLSVPLGHGRRCLGHNGHGERFDPIQTAVGAVIVWVMLRVFWDMAWRS